MYALIKFQDYFNQGLQIKYIISFNKNILLSSFPKAKFIYFVFK